MTNKYLIIGAAAAGVALVYLAKEGVKALPGVVADALGDAAHAVNPWNNDNIINQGANNLYQWKTGSTGTIGGDIFDAQNGDIAKAKQLQDLIGDYNPAVQVGKAAANGMEWLLKAVTGDEYEIDLQKKLWEWRESWM